jgi:2-hydroxychromene-2-carboxylate isomerase
MHLEMYLDYRSAYSYLATSQLGQLGVEIDYTVLNIVNVMRMVNNHPVPTCPPKQNYSSLDVSRWADLYGVVYAPNLPMFKAMASGQLEGALLSRAGLAAQELGVFETFNIAMFAALWAGDDDISTEESRARFLAKHELPSSLFEKASEQAIVARLSGQDEAAAERGVFGVPTFFVDGEMFFGNDRLPFIKARLKGARIPEAII